MINSEYLKNLNNFQKEAVYIQQGRLIVAGAGSGKTRFSHQELQTLLKKI